jgi:hypothetical protein
MRRKSVGWICDSCGETKCYAGKLEYINPCYCPYIHDAISGCKWRRIYKSLDHDCDERKLRNDYEILLNRIRMLADAKNNDMTIDWVDGCANAALDEIGNEKNKTK